MNVAVNKKRAMIFFVVGFFVLTLALFFRKGAFIGFGSAMVIVPLGSLFTPFRSRAHQFRVWSILIFSLAVYVFLAAIFFRRFF